MFGENFQIHGADITGNTFANQKIEYGQFNPPSQTQVLVTILKARGNYSFPSGSILFPQPKMYMCVSVCLCVYI